MIQTLAKQQHRTTVFAVFCWLLLSIFSCGSLANAFSALPQPSSLLNSADQSIASAMVDLDASTMALVEQQMPCCDEQLLDFDCCEQSPALRSSQVSEESSYNTASITPDFATSVWAYSEVNGLGIALRRSLHPHWLMDSFPRRHLVHCTLLD